jgi:hypothetical protein
MLLPLLALLVPLQPQPWQALFVEQLRPLMQVQLQLLLPVSRSCSCLLTVVGQEQWALGERAQGQGMPQQWAAAPSPWPW